ncbi:MAG: tetratricopeptide repeat protein [Reichenbachiella sp.]
MTIRQWVIIVLASVSVIVLYNLPRSVVDNDSQSAIIDSKVSTAEALHSFELPIESKARVRSLQNLIVETSDKKKCAIFADSLATIYLLYNYLDSAEAYADQILDFDSDYESQVRAGEIFFQLYGVSADLVKTKNYASKAAICFETALIEEKNPDLESKLAMTKVVTSNPMEGIMMLRKVLEEYPENKTALYSMGVLSMQSGQYEKAVERFEKLMVIDKTNDQAAYYLAVSYFETGNNIKSQEWFEKIKTLSGDPAILESTDQYLKKLNEL